MKKLSKFESAIIVSSLNNSLSHDLAVIQEGEKAGKNPLFTQDYLTQTYLDLIQRVKEMTKRK
jgi:hypothetical protein